MSDLKYSVEVTGLKDVEQLEKNLDRLHNTLNAGKGMGKSLEEMRKILVGMKGQSSIIADLRDSVKSLNSAAENLGKGFESGFNRLDKTLKQGFQLTIDRVNMLGAEISKGLSSGVSGAFDAGARVAAEGGKKVAAAMRAAGEEVSSELASWHAKDIKLNAKYAADLGVAQQQVLDKGTSTMVSSLRKRAEIISRLIQEEGVVGQEVATKAYGTDFVNAVKAGLIGQQKLFEDHIKTVKKLGEAQVEAYAGKMNQQAVDRARAVAKEQLAANSQAIKEELAAAAQSFTNSPDTLANMQKFYTLQASVAKSSTDRARAVAREQFQANSRAIKEELAAAAQSFANSPDTLANMQKFYTLQASVAQSSTDRARAVAREQFQANSRAIKEELAAAAQAFMSSEETLRSMRQFYTLQASVAQASTDRARAVAREQFQANSRAIKEELAAAAAAHARSPDTLANMRKFYTMQESAAKYVEDRARKEAREAFAARSKAFKEEAAKFSESSYDVGMRQLASQYTDRGEIKAMEQLRLAADAATVSKKRLADSGPPLSKSLKSLAIDGNDTHSAMRGLASGFNLLWLTWGNLAPLFGGAAISNGFMQTAKQGMEVAHTLEIVAALGENSTDSMKDLTSELIRLGHNGPRGPLEIAEAIKTLSLAGLEANKILAVTGTVLNFSTSGTTSLQTAADVLVSVTTAFGTGAAGFERSADIITRAAADSKASVESFGEAMKTASVAGEQYGAKQEDVALLIQLLAQVGIQGSAAGTSVRNMYADITGRSGQVGKILKSLKLDFKDLDGNVVSTVEQMRMLDEVLKQYDSKSQGNIIQAIYGERGAKAAIAALQAYRTAAQDSSKYANKLEEDFAKVANAAADSAIAAAKLGQTSQKAFETAGATMRTTMFEAFREIEPQLYMTAVAFQEAFGSAETRALLQSMTSAVATLGMAVAENLEPIAKVAILWAEYRLALFAVNNVLAASAALKQSYAAVTKALTAATVADTTATALNNAAKASPALASAAAGRVLYTANLTASTGAVLADTTATAANTRAKQANQLATAGIGMTVLKALPVVGNAIALASVAWMVFKSATDDAGSAVENYAQTKSDKIAEKLEQEAEHLRRVNEERLKGIGLMEAEARVRESYDREASVADLTTEEDKLRSKLNNLNALKENIEKSTRKGDQGVLDAVVNNIQATDAALTAAMVSRAAAEDRFDRAAAERRKRTKESNDIAVKEAADQAKQLKDALEKGVGGLKTWSLTDFQGGGGGAGGNSQVSLNRDKELQALKAHFDSELAIANDYYGKAKQLLDGHRSANLITEEEYMVQSLQLARTHEAEQLQVLENSLTAYTEASEKRKAALESQLGGAKGKGKSMLLEQLKRETQEFEIFVTEYEKQRAKVAAESYARVSDTVLKLQSEVGKLLKTSRDFWDNAKVSSEAQKEADELANKYASMNTSILSMDSAMFEFEKAQKSVQDEVKKMNAALSKQLSIQKNLLQVELLSLQAAKAAGNLTMEEAIQRSTLIAQFKDGIRELEADIENNTEQGLKLGAEKGWEAFQKMREKQVHELANSMSEAITDGLMSGDYKSIGKNILRILQQELLRKTLVAKITGVLDGLIGGISSAIFGGGGGGGGLAGNLLGYADKGMSLYNTYQNAPGWFNTATNWLGLGGGNAAGGLSAATAAGSIWGGGAAASSGLGMSLGGSGLGMAAPTTGFWAPGAASAAGSSGLAAGLKAAGPWIAGAAALAAAFGAFRKTKVVDTGIMGTLGVEGGIHDFTQKRKSGSLFSGPKYTLVDEGVSSFDKPMQDAFKTMRQAAIGMGKILGLTTDHLKDFTTAITLDSADSKSGTRGLNLKDLSESEVQAKIQQALEQANNELAQQLIGSWESVTTTVEEKFISFARNASNAVGLDSRGSPFKTVSKEVTTSVYTPSEFAREGETAIETLTRLASSLSTVNSSLELLGIKLYETSLAGADMASKLVDMFGGLEGFTAVTSSYYQNFYSEEERFRKAGESVNAALAAMGVQLNVFGGEAAKIQYRNLVEKAFADGNQELAAQLLQTSAAFAQVADAAESSKEALVSAYKQEREALENRLLTLLGDTAELRRRELAALSPGNRELQVRIWKLEDERAIAQERLSLEQKLLQVQGNTAELRRRELAALDASNVAIQLHIWALEDLATAQSRYDSAVSGVASAEAAVESVRDKATSAYLSALSKVNTLQQSIAEDFRSIFESLSEYLDSFKAPSEQFAQTLKKALAGDSEAMKKLPNLADSAISTEKDSARDLVEFQRKQADILRGVREAAKLAEQKAAAEADKALTMQEQLLQAQKELADAAKVANDIGASLVSKQDDLVAEYKKANANLQEALKEREAALVELEKVKQQLADIEKNTSNTNDSVKNLKFQIDAAEIEARLAVDAVINSKVYETLPEATKLLVLGTQDSLRRAIDVIIQDNGLSDELKLLSIGVVGNITKLVDVIIKDSGLSNELKAIGVGVAGNITELINVIVKDSGLSNELKAIGVGVADSITKQVDVTINNPDLTANLKAIGIGEFGDITKYINTIVKDVKIPTDVKDLLLSSAAKPYVTATSLLVNLSSALTADQRLVLTQAQGTIKKVVDTAVSGGYISSDQRKILDQATQTVYKTANALATGGNLTDNQRKILDAVTGNTTIAASVSLENRLAADGGLLAYSKAEVAAVYNAIAHNTFNSANYLANIVNQLSNGIRVKYDRGATSPSGNVYANGGAFTNSVVKTPTFFNESLMGEAGPEAIMPLTNIGGSLGVRATMPDNSELIAEVKALQALVARLLYANEATARNTHASRKQLERWDGDGLPEVRDVTTA